MKVFWRAEGLLFPLRLHRRNALGCEAFRAVSDGVVFMAFAPKIQPGLLPVAAYPDNCQFMQDAFFRHRLPISARVAPDAERLRIARRHRRWLALKMPEKYAS
ncbi:hypothetical protein [Collimonas sp. PA-H2]|uniref:hypothetical protein n=1 Tax=Collimonas sp. PA-H2 TaxID=1881062 RepID=UPI00117E4DE1|nr:hypothetical protein [Collimonas sp. PA-H2]